MKIIRGAGVLGILLGWAVQTGHTEDAGIRPVGHTAPTASPSLEGTVTFSQLSARVGDRVSQTVEVALDVDTTITQAEQQAHTSKTSMRRQQQRLIEIVAVDGGKVHRAYVTYPISRVTTSESSNPGQEVVQAVEKKSYFVARKGEQLLVTDSDGSLPPQKEFEIVVTSLQNFGLPNPLVKFLLGRTVRVGERLLLPQVIGEQLMGFGGELGKVEKFELELKAIRTLDEQPCAVFSATIEAVGQEPSPVRIHAHGQVVIQTKTSRVVRATLSGPLTLSAVEQTAAGPFQYLAKGGMRVSIESQYGHARQ